MSVSRAQDQDCGESPVRMPGPPGPEEQPVYTSQQLFCGATEIGIDHRGARYRLRITRQGKLILNK